MLSISSEHKPGWFKFPGGIGVDESRFLDVQAGDIDVILFVFAIVLVLFLLPVFGSVFEVVVEPFIVHVFYYGNIIDLWG